MANLERVVDWKGVAGGPGEGGDEERSTEQGGVAVRSRR
jgi:hypothetical protein